METKTTIRLGELEKDSITKIRALSGENTDAGAIRYACRCFPVLNDRFLSEQKENKKLEAKNRELREAIQNFNHCLEVLNNFNLKEK